MADSVSMSDPAPVAAPASIDPFASAIQKIDRHASKVLALCSSPHSPTDITRTVLPGPWRHPSELEYIGPTHSSAATWNDYSIIAYLVHTAISIPPRSESRSDPWVLVSNNDSGTTTLPRGYRVPLLWLMKVQWESLRLLLTDARPLWDFVKFDLLHIARLTTQFLAKARNEERMKRQWRDAMFDRPMTRFFNGWLGCRDVFIWDFYREFREEEYKDDVLARRWSQKSPKGIQGFAISEQELIDGITAQQYMLGLNVDHVNQKFEWIAAPEPEQPPTPPVLPAQRMNDEDAVASNSRGSSPLTSDMSEVDMIAESLNPRASNPSTPVPTHPHPQRPPIPLSIQTAPELLQRKRSHRAKPRPKGADGRPENLANRPIRTRTMSGSVSGLSPATPKIAHHLSGPVVGSSNASSPSVGFDFTAPIESRGRKRKIESVYSVSPSPLTSDTEDDGNPNGKGSRESKKWTAPGPRPIQSATPDGRLFTTHSRIVIPRLANPELYSKPTLEVYSGAPVDLAAIKVVRKASVPDTPSGSGSASASASVSAPAPTPTPTSASANANASSSNGSPRKTKPSIVPMNQHYKLYAISSSPSPNPYDPATAASIPPFHTWRHPEELDYIGPAHASVIAGQWSDFAIVAYMVEHAFTIPSRNADSRQTWVEVKVPATGVSVTLPRGYRIPLLWLGRVQWDCLKLLLTSATEYWDALKFDVLHLARLGAVFLAKARNEPKIKRQYRDVMFDRALSRMFNGWMGSRDEFVWDFYREFRDEEYEDDMLARRWLQKAVKGIQGFALTEQELNEGITAEQYVNGLKVDREKGTFEWIDDSVAAEVQSVSNLDAAAAAVQAPSPVMGVTPMPVEVTPTFIRATSVVARAPGVVLPTWGTPVSIEGTPVSAEEIQVEEPADVPMVPASADASLPRAHSPMPAPESHAEATPPRAQTPTLSLTQVAGVHSRSPSPLTSDMAMDVDHPAVPPPRVLEEEPVVVPSEPSPPSPQASPEPTGAEMSAVEPVAMQVPDVVSSEPPTPLQLGSSESDAGEISAAEPIAVVARVAVPSEPPPPQHLSPEPDGTEMSAAPSELPQSQHPSPEPHGIEMSAAEPIPMEVPVAVLSELPPTSLQSLPEPDGIEVSAEPIAAEASVVVPLELPSPLQQFLPESGDSEMSAAEHSAVEAPSLPQLASSGPGAEMSEPERSSQKPDVTVVQLEITKIVPEPSLPSDVPEPSLPSVAITAAELSVSPLHRYSSSPAPGDAPPETVSAPAQNTPAQNDEAEALPPPVPHWTPSSPDTDVHDEDAQGESVEMDIVDGDVVYRTAAPLPDPQENGLTNDGSAGAGDVMNGMDEVAPVSIPFDPWWSDDDQGLMYLSSDPPSPVEDATGAGAAADSNTIAEDLLHPPGVSGLPMNGLVPPAAAPADDLEFDETDYLRSRLPSPFATTPPPQLAQAHSPKQVSKSPLVAPPVEVSAEPPSELTIERVPSPQPMSPRSDSESIRSSSSPEPRPTQLPESLPESLPEQRQGPASPDTAHTEEPFPSPPPDSEEEEEDSAAQELVAADTDAETAGASDLTASAPDEESAPSQVEGVEPDPVEAAHVLPLSVADATDEFPPGFHFMGGIPQETPSYNISQTTPVPEPTPAPASQSPTQLVFDNVGSDCLPSEGMHVTSAETSRSSPSITGRVRTPSPPPDGITLSAISSPASPLSAEAVLSNLPQTVDSKRVKLEIMTISLNTEGDSNDVVEIEGETDMDIGTPIEMDMDDPIPDLLSPLAVVDTSQTTSPPLEAGQSLFTPDVTPRSSAVPPPPSPPPPMSNLDDEYMVPPGLSSIANSTTAPMNDLFGRTSTPSRHSPPPASASHRPPFGRTPVLPAQNMSNSANNAPEPQSGIFTNGGPRPGRHFLRDKPPPPPPPGAHRPDLPMDGMNDGFRSPIRIPDSANEYDPRRRDPIILGPTSSYSLSNSSPSIPPAPAYQRWMSYSGQSSVSAVYHQPYSPLVSLNSRMSPQLLPPSPSAHHVTSGPAIEVIGARPPSRQFSSTPEVPTFNSQTPIPIPTARLPSPRRSFSNDSLFNPSSKPPSPPSHAMLPPTTVDRVVVPQARPAVTYAPRVTPPEVDSAPEVDMGNYDTSTSPRRSPSPATSFTPAPNAALSPRSPSPTQVSRVSEIDMRSLENSLIERLKGELRSQLKDELKDELKGELRGELRDELRGELKNELKGEIVGQMEEELPGRMKHQLLGQLKAELLGQIKDDLLHQLKEELFVQMKAELLTHMKAELVHQLKDELLFQLKDELLRQLQEELLVLLKNELKVQLADDLTTTVKNNLRGQLRADLRDDMVDELKDHFTAQLQDQLKALLLRLQHAMNSQLRDDLTIQLKYFIAKLKEELIVQLKDTLTVHLQDGLITQVKTALTAQLRDGLGAQREQLNLDFERRRLFLEQQPRTKAVKPASPAVTTPSRATPTTPRPLPSLLFQARHPLHHLVLTAGSDLAGMDVDVVPPPTPPISLSPSKPRGNETPLPVKSQRKQSFFAGYQASPPA